MAKQSATDLNFQTWMLRVPIHCPGCKKRITKILKSIDGVYSIVIDSEQQKAVVIGSVDGETLVRILQKSGKHASLLPESFDQMAAMDNVSGKPEQKEDQNNSEHKSEIEISSVDGQDVDENIKTGEVLAVAINSLDGQDADENIKTGEVLGVAINSVDGQDADENIKTEKVSAVEINSVDGHNADENIKTEMVLAVTEKTGGEIAEVVAQTSAGADGGKKKIRKKKKKKGKGDNNGVEGATKGNAPADTGSIPVTAENVGVQMEQLNLSPPVRQTGYTAPYNEPPYESLYPTPVYSYQGAESSHYAPPVYGYDQSHPSTSYYAPPPPSRSAFDDHYDDEERGCAII